MIDPIIELFKSVDVAIVAALGVVIVLVLEQLIGGALNQETFWRWKNPFYQWHTDRVLPVITFLIGAIYGWCTAAKVAGYADNFRWALLYGAAVLGVSRVLHKTILGKSTNNKTNGG